MKYEVLAKTYSELENTASTLSKIELISNILKKTPKDLLRKITYLLRGQIFPSYNQVELNMAEKLAITAISRAVGSSKEKIIEKLKSEGDLGSATGVLLKNRNQTTLFQDEVSVNKVYSSFERIARMEGEGSVERKISILSDLISNSDSLSAKYIIRTVLAQLRIGVGDGTMKNAIAKAFEIEPKLVEKAQSVLNDFGEVALLAKKGGDALNKVTLNIGRPLKAMLYPKAEDIEDGIQKISFPLQVEYKYDGFRTQIHKDGKNVKIFTRRMDDVTRQFDDVVKAIMKCVTVKDIVLDSETVGINPQTKQWVPFQKISQRIKRKHDLKRMEKEIPVITYVFDILFLDGLNLIDLPLKERFEILKKSFKQSERVKLVDFVRVKNRKELEGFYQKALNNGAEGVMLKDINSPYKPGQRVGYGYKLKPEAESLDLVIVGAEWGQGKRSEWLSSFILAAKQDEKLVEIGRMATGTTEQDLENLTNALKPLILQERGQIIRVKPKIVVEVGFQEIQKSSKYESGFALRFPRLLRIRDDKSVDEINDTEKIHNLFVKQFRHAQNR